MLNIKEYFKLTGVYTFFFAFPAILQLIVYPLIEGNDRLGAADFGHLAITEAIVSFITVFIVFGSIIAISRFYYDYSEREQDLNGLISTIVNGVLFRFAVILGLVLIFGNFIGGFFSERPLQEFSRYGPELVVIALSRSIIGVSTILFRNEKNVRNFIIVSFISAILRSAFQLIGVLYFDMSFLGYVYGTALGSGLVTIGIIFYLYKRCGFAFRKDLRRSLTSFTLPLVFNDLIYWGIMFIDRFFLLDTPKLLGIYDNAMKFAIGIQLIIQGMASAVQPELFRFLKEGVEKTEYEIKKISNLFVVQSVLIVALSVIPVMLFISIFYETELRYSAGLLPLIFSRFILVSQYQVYSWPIIYKKKTLLFFLINALAFAVSILMNYFLIPVIGYYGAIMSFLVAYCIQVVLFRNFVNRMYQLKWNNLKMFYFPFSIVFVCGIAEIVRLSFNMNQFITAGGFILYIIGGIMLLYKSEFKKLIEKIKTLKLSSTKTQ